MSSSHLNNMYKTFVSWSIGSDSKWILLMLSSAVVVYVALRSHFLGFTYDEISTLTFARNFSWSGIADSAGIHLLNALLTVGVLRTGSTSEFAIRLPSTLALIPYLWAALELGRYVRKELRLLQFVLLVLNPFVLDFFSLSRGYGLGMGAMLPSLAFALRFRENGRMEWAMLALFAAMASVVASYTMLNYFLPLVIVLLGLMAFATERWKKKALRIAPMLFFVMVFLAFVLPILFTLKERGELYFGGRSDLLSDTVSSLGRSFAYHAPYKLAAAGLFFLLFAVAVIFAVRELLRSIRPRISSTSLLLGLLFLLSLSAPVAQHLLLGTNLPVERTALMFYPLVALLVMQAFQRMTWRTGKPISTVLVISLVAHFLATANLTHTYSWRFDGGSPHVMKYIEQNTEGKVRIGHDYIHAPSIGYYRQEFQLTRFTTDQLTECWDHCLELEELDMAYYGMTKCNKLMDAQGMLELLSGKYDMYYLDNYYLQQMDRLGVSYKVDKRFPYSRTSLISEVRY